MNNRVSQKAAGGTGYAQGRKCVCVCHTQTDTSPTWHRGCTLAQAGAWNGDAVTKTHRRGSPYLFHMHIDTIRKGTSAQLWDPTSLTRGAGGEGLMLWRQSSPREERGRTGRGTHAILKYKPTVLTVAIPYQPCYNAGRSLAQQAERHPATGLQAGEGEDVLPGYHVRMRWRDPIHGHDTRIVAYVSHRSLTPPHPYPPTSEAGGVDLGRGTGRWPRCLGSDWMSTTP